MNRNQASVVADAKSTDSNKQEIPEVGSPPEIASSGRGSCLKKFALAFVMLLLAFAVVVWYALVEAQRLPEFYSQVLETDTTKAEADGRLFERNLVQLRNTARRKLPWLIEITQDQVNGWFTSDLPEKFPESLPADISDPRVVFTQDEIRLAFKYKVRGISGIVVISADVFCTDKSNEIAVQLNDVRTGVLPLPVGPWLEKVAEGIRNAGIPVFWSKAGESPVAVFTLPEHVTTNATQHVNVEAIDLRPQRLIIAGKTILKKQPQKTSKPNGALEDINTLPPKDKNAVNDKR